MPITETRAMKFIFSWTAFALLLAGCACASQHVKYSVVLANEGTNAIRGAHVRYDKFESVGGYLRPGVKKVDTFVPVPIPEHALVVWKGEDGKAHEKKVPVQRLLPKGFSGEIIFAIKDDGGVTITNRPFQDLPQNWKVAPK